MRRTADIVWNRIKKNNEEEQQRIKKQLRNMKAASDKHMRQEYERLDCGVQTPL